MYSPNVHTSCAAAFVEGLNDVLEQGRLVAAVVDPASPGSDFGRASRPTIELLGYAFTIDDPQSLLFLSEERTLRLPYCFGLLLWSLAGADDADWLGYYHPGARHFSDDGHRLRGAFGHRLFASDGSNQIAAIADRITADPASRRTVAMISTVEDNFRLSKEYPCGIAVQYLLRDGALHAITYMRSQSALGVLPYDVFLFAGLQWHLSRCW